MRFSCLVLLVGFLPGCWEKSVATTSVHGHVYFHDRPLNRGTIVFAPDAERGAKGELAKAEIQPDGSYVLLGKNAAPIAPGWHRVTILALEAATSSGAVENFREPRSLIPDRYRDPNLSDIAVEVIPDQENIKDFHLD